MLFVGRLYARPLSLPCHNIWMHDRNANWSLLLANDAFTQPPHSSKRCHPATFGNHVADLEVYQTDITIMLDHETLPSALFCRTDHASNPNFSATSGPKPATTPDLSHGSHRRTVRGPYIDVKQSSKHHVTNNVMRNAPADLSRYNADIRRRKR
jgi:hypothetical protein